MTQKPTVVFDFDGTIIPKDSYYDFTKRLISKSFFRVFLNILCLPLIVPLVCIPPTRKWGFSIPCFLATVLQSSSLFKLRKEFVKWFLKEPNTNIYQQALEDIKRHQSEGKEVVIISGCPKWLLQALVKAIGIRNVQIIGSKQKLLLSGLVITHHCYGANKISMATEAGQLTSNWMIGYSDSPTDIPMLNLCKKAVLINSSSSASNQFKKKLNISYTHRTYR